MSWISNVKALATAAANTTKAAAIAAKDATVKAVHDLQDVPTEVQCVNCPAILAVPPRIWDWQCASPQCEEKQVVNTKEHKECPECKTAKPNGPPPTIQCNGCGAITPVPSSNAEKHLVAAKKATVAGAVAVKEGVVSTYDNLVALPKEVDCPNCALKIPVPHHVFDWACAAAPCAKTNDVNQKECLECKAPRVEMPVPKVTCEACQTVVPVPLSNARKHLNSAARVTKSAAVGAGQAIKGGIDHLRANPNQFNCSHCTQLLEVPPNWLCACGVENSRTDNAEACRECQVKRSRNPEDDCVMCGNCSLPTPVPASNLANMAKTKTKVAHRGMLKLFYGVRGKPYINCDNCKATIPLPEGTLPEQVAQEGEPEQEAAEVSTQALQKEVACPTCGKVFRARKGSDPLLAEGDQPAVEVQAAAS